MVLSYLYITIHPFPVWTLWANCRPTGRNILRTFDIGSFKSIKTKCWLPGDLAVVDDGRIFVADRFKHRLFLLNQQMTDYQLLTEHSAVEPFRLYYIQHKQQLIVGEMNHYEPRVSILHLSPCEAVKGTRVGQQWLMKFILYYVYAQ